MAFIKTVPEQDADSLLNDLYQAEKKSNGYIPNYTTIFSLNPEAYDAWKKLIGSIRSRMRLRRYELVTFATAMATHCTY